MDLPLSRAVTAVARLDWLDRAGSTNDVLVRAASGGAGDRPDFSVVVTDDQTAGRGRLGRSWSAPAGRTLAISVLLRPQDAAGRPISAERFGLLPLLAGVAMARAVGGALAGAGAGMGAGDGADAGADAGAGLGAARVAVKWPNDVLVGERKISGILGELLPDASGLVLGAGVNLTLAASDLPTPTATSLMLEGATGEALAADTVLAAYLAELAALYADWRRGDDRGLEAATELSATLGRAVRIELPGGTFRTGVARAIEADGRLTIDARADDGGVEAITISAGDVTHLRHDDRGNQGTR